METNADGTNRPEAEEFVEWVLFHATVCKHENVVRMMHCRTKRLPLCLLLETCSPGNLLHFLWTLRNVTFVLKLDRTCRLQQAFFTAANTDMSLRVNEGVFNAVN